VVALHAGLCRPVVEGGGLVPGRVEAPLRVVPPPRPAAAPAEAPVAKRRQLHGLHGLRGREVDVAGFRLWVLRLRAFPEGAADVEGYTRLERTVFGRRTFWLTRGPGPGTPREG
jgi:hypothetical protein